MTSSKYTKSRIHWAGRLSFLLLGLSLLLLSLFSCEPVAVAPDGVSSAKPLERRTEVQVPDSAERVREKHTEGHPETPPTEKKEPETAAPPDRDAFDFTKARRDFQEKYGLPLVLKPTFPVKTRHGDIDGKAASDVALLSYGRIFVQEWNLYPPALIKKTRLAKVVLCAGLSFAGQARSAIPDFEHDVLYLDVERGRASKEYIRRTIHHEYFHIIDYRDDLKVYSDPQWETLNPKGFKYGAGGQSVQGDPSGSLFTEDLPGFFTKYSLSGVEEDKAEVFSVMIVLGKKARSRAGKDAVLAAKIQRMKQLLRDFCPDIGEAFWSAAEGLRRGD